MNLVIWSQLISGGSSSSSLKHKLLTVIQPHRIRFLGAKGPITRVSYCGWKKSCTTLDGWEPIKNGIHHLSTGAGFLPSTVSWNHLTHFDTFTAYIIDICVIKVRSVCDRAHWSWAPFTGSPLLSSLAVAAIASSFRRRIWSGHPP